MSNKDKELAKVEEETSLTTFDAGAADELLNVDNISLGMLTHVKCPTGGASSFTVDETLTKEIVGIVVSADTTRVMFPDNSVVGSGDPPQCSAVSQPGVALTGVGLPGGACGVCPMAQFGSKGKGCMCDERRELFVITKDNEVIPIRISIPPTSLANWNLHTFKLRQRKLNLFAVWTSFTIAMKKGRNGMYAVIVPTLKGELTQDELMEYGPTIKKLRTMHLPQPKSLEDVFED